MANEDAVYNALTAADRAIPLGVKASEKPIETYIKAKVSRPYPPASRPGSPPHRRSGRFRRNWRVRANGKTLIIRNFTFYAGFLEAGTRFMAARPTLTGRTVGNLTALVQSATDSGIEAGNRVRLGVR